MREKLKVVMVEPRHLGDIDRLHDQQEKSINRGRKLKVKVDRPLVLDSPVLLSLGVERDGKFIGGLYIEAVGEMCFIGEDAEATAALMEYADEIASFLQKRGIRWWRSFTPNTKKYARLKKAFAKCGFEDASKQLKHYARFTGKREK